MIVVLDTNILFSALISPHGPPGLIFDAWREGRFDLATCTAQIEEIRKASRYPKFRAILQPYRVGIVINNMRRARIWTDPLPKIHEAADPTDSFLLNLAEAVEAHYLVTGDKRSHILEQKRVGKTRIITAQSFCKRVLQL
jgi:putative PIN family toxin of toxin-antitoxin system